MATVLILDNDVNHRLQMQGALNKRNHDAICVHAGATDEMARLAEEKLRQIASPDAPVDVLVLDMRLDDAELGGAIVYEKLIAAGCRALWKHVVVVSIWCEGGTQAEALRQFMQDNAIPMENCLPKRTARTERLVNRILELVE
ncbi:MAG: hypothetical protein KF841_03025 [Phycisphaerae bacterium]|nr:hypothetical protein [Phycisphaerae bacterium]